VIKPAPKTKQQVEDVSARLTIERCEYEDKTRRQQQQESEDALHGGNVWETVVPPFEWSTIWRRSSTITNIE
jgi:hypothetical protein